MKKTKIKYGALIMASVMFMGLTMGCSVKDQPTDKKVTEANDNKQEEASATEKTDDPKDKSLIIYTNSGGDGRGEWLTELAAQEGFELNVVNVGGGDLTNRAIAEKNNQIADLVFGLNPVEYEKMKKEELLWGFEPTWAKEVDQTLVDKDGLYYPIVVQPLLMCYNKEYVNEQSAPQDWTDLSKPEYKDKYTYMGLGGGTSKNLFAGLLVRYADPNGEYGISKEGWEMAKGYLQNGHLAQEGEDWYGNALSGERPMTMIWGSGLLQYIKERGGDFGFLTPDVGVPFVVEEVAIFANSKKKEVAKEFIDWFGSVEIQSQWSEKYGTTPAHPKALENAAPEVRELMEAVTAQDIDWSFVAENIDKWVEKAELELIQ